MATQLNTFFQSTILMVILILTIYFGSNIVMPLLFSILASVALTPISRRLEQWGLGRTWAAISIIVMGTLVFTGIILILYTQAQSLIDSLPELAERFDKWVKTLTSFIQREMDISTIEQKQILESNSEQIISSNFDFVQSSFSALVDFMSFMAITPVYIVFMLIYRANLRAAISRFSKTSNTEKLSISIVNSIENGLQRYLRGILIVTILIAIMNAIGFMIIGLDYAILLAVFGALLAVIPYIGVFLGALIPVLVALLTKDQIIYPIAVLGIAVFVQFLEGNFITPRIIGNSVGVNPAVIIFFVIAMGSLAGIIGMVLAAPLLAVLKIVCENVDSLKPMGALISVNLPDPSEE